MFGSRFDLGFGGKGANQAVAAALCGARVHMVARVGDDLFGPAYEGNAFISEPVHNLVHREIVSARNRRRPQTIQVLLPEAGAPSGRPLGDDEMRPVTWTLSHPEDDRIDQPMERRRRRLLRLLTEANSAGTVPSIEVLADALEVSAATVRRDLTALRQQGQPFFTRGQMRRSQVTEGSG